MERRTDRVVETPDALEAGREGNFCDRKRRLVEQPACEMDTMRALERRGRGADVLRKEAPAGAESRARGVRKELPRTRARRRRRSFSMRAKPSRTSRPTRASRARFPAGTGGTGGTRRLPRRRRTCRSACSSVSEEVRGSRAGNRCASSRRRRRIGPKSGCRGSGWPWCGRRSRCPRRESTPPRAKN